MELTYSRTVTLDLNNITSVLEKEIREFNSDRAMTISMFMHNKEAEGFDFTPYQDSLWLELTRLIEATKGKR